MNDPDKKNIQPWLYNLDKSNKLRLNHQIKIKPKIEPPKKIINDPDKKNIQRIPTLIIQPQ